MLNLKQNQSFRSSLCDVPWLIDLCCQKTNSHHKSEIYPVEAKSSVLCTEDAFTLTLIDVLQEFDIIPVCFLVDVVYPRFIETISGEKLTMFNSVCEFLSMSKYVMIWHDDGWCCKMFTTKLELEDQVRYNFNNLGLSYWGSNIWMLSKSKSICLRSTILRHFDNELSGFRIPSELVPLILSFLIEDVVLLSDILSFEMIEVDESKIFHP